MKKYNFSKGRRGEEEARDFLVKKNFELIENNYRCQIGEIDLIMSEGDWLVFVEVKYKADDWMGLPEEMIDKRKLAKVKRVGQWYLVENEAIKKKYEKYRIDAVCILGKTIKHYKNIG